VNVLIPHRHTSSKIVAVSNSYNRKVEEWSGLSVKYHSPDQEKYLLGGLTVDETNKWTPGPSDEESNVNEQYNFKYCSTTADVPTQISTNNSPRRSARCKNSLAEALLSNCTMKRTFKGKGSQLGQVMLMSFYSMQYYFCFKFSVLIELC
jgi:hypothetical protein